MKPPVGRGFAAIEDADVVETEKAALEDVAALGVLAVHPPGEVQHQLVEDALEKLEIALVAALLSVDLKDAPRGPGVHRRVHVAERPLVGGKLPVRVHVPLAREQHELLLRELRIDERERQAVKREIPGGVPGVFPLVRHRDHVVVHEVIPIGVAPRFARSAGGGGCDSSPSSQVRTS